ncbi:unnamed protein product [Rotaria magnacalcarata]|uniref:G-protein coupled receptors family 1 profile domain-containing protein n=2 Tax=Rotaria magnacalcarata TaxID=392030 RepID=A0A816DQN8_9BILA|nr:unnamed protein product [Rotaria magnacalcarata]CAF1637695.1 unnamed protein product [Rotaria magnacalcarata]CAF2042029.1 unnamed protein product [Rotaria magnacalcarata]CAF2126171.1 unnamed protein product [Rotaria magnacalcarata]CAF2259518.1 unnamed protein product [Rotaria magnacalcarata]
MDANDATNNSLTDDNTNAGLPIIIQCIFLFLFAVVVILAVTGNSIVIWIVLAHRRMRTPTNYFLINLAYADVLNAIFNIPFNGYYMVVQVPWPFGSFMCFWVQAVSHISIAANVLTYVAISLDRYFAIIHPLRTKLTHKQTLMIICSIWILSFLVSSPAILSYSHATSYCKLAKDDSLDRFEWIFFSVTYVCPIVILTITYTRIAIELWGQTAIGEVTKRQRDTVQSKRKIVKMLIAVVLIFGICWFPQQLYFILLSLFPSIPTLSGTPYAYLISYFFAMTNSMYNPFLYCCMNNRFRNGFRSVFRYCPCVEWSPEYSCEGYVSCRSLSEPTALSVVYSSQRRSRATIGAANSSQQSSATANEFSFNYNRQHRQN